jgi:enamine deaminase RidA (YjgF/YER057c/UK114 family)
VDTAGYLLLDLTDLDFIDSIPTALFERVPGLRGSPTERTKNSPSGDFVRLEGVAVDRVDVNPWEWSKAFGFSQAVNVSGGGQVLYCAGQTATGPDGAPPTTTDMTEQVELAFANLKTVLEAADMTLADIVRLTVYTTDVDALLAGYGSVAGALAPNLPAMTLIGVARLAFPELMVEVEAIAVR